MTLGTVVVGAEGVGLPAAAGGPAEAGAIVGVGDAVAELGRGVVMVVLLLVVVVVVLLLVVVVVVVVVDEDDEDDEAGVVVVNAEVSFVVAVPDAASVALDGRPACTARLGVWDRQGPLVSQTVTPMRSAAVTAASAGNFLFVFALWRPAISVPFSYCG